MKRIAFITLLFICAIAVSAQTKKVSVLGDSYSTFKGSNPNGYAPFYPDANNDVKEVDQTWWSLYIKAKGYELDKNNSWGGTTICGTGYFRRDVFDSYFISRVDMLGDPDIIFVFGGTNDAWPGPPWANTSIPTGRKMIARVSVPHLPACWTCFRGAIRKRRFIPS